jgi:N-acetylated-alpha-linked acidic dipeptidase
VSSLGAAAIPDVFTDLHRAAGELQAATAAFNIARRKILAGADTLALDRLNAALIQVERQFTDPGGIPKRPWYRHQIFAPKYTYAPEVLPGVAEAVETRDLRAAREQAARISAALRRAARVLRLEL